MIFRPARGFVLAVGFVATLQTAVCVRADNFDQDRRYGYVSSTEEEQALSEDHPISMPELPSDPGPTLHDRLFNEQLTKEFRQHYEEQFGRTAAEQNVNFYSNPNVSYLNDQGVAVSALDQNAAQQAYGNYMLAKLAEYHLDNWAKKDESTRGIYNMKEKLSKFQGEVAPGISFQANYSISENSFDAELKNPWVHTRWRYLLTQQEIYLQFDRQFTPSYSIANYIAMRDATVKLVGSKGLTPRITFTQTFGTYFGTGYNIRETIGLLGFEFRI